MVKKKLKLNTNISNILKQFGIWFISIMFLEIIFIVIMGNRFEFDSILNTFLFTFIVSAILSLVVNIFEGKTNTIITSIILFILGVLYSIQCVFFDLFKVYFSLTNLALGDQATSFLGKAFEAIFRNIFNIIIFMLPFILYLILHKKFGIKKNNKVNYITFGIIILLFIPLFFVKILSTKGKINDAYDLYYNVNEVSLNINKLGVLNSYVLDFRRLVFGFSPRDINYVDVDGMKEGEDITEEEAVVTYEPNKLDLNLKKETSSSSIKMINSYIESDTPTMKNSYTGLFKGYNLIYITAESFSEIGISKELTPTLYKLTHTGFVFENYYTPNALSTIGGEFQSMTGLYPDSAILSKWRSGNNYFPYGLGTVFKGLDYNTYAYHNNYYAFQDRNKYMVSQGFNNYIGCYNGMEKRLNCKIWPQSDDDMIKETVNDYINSDKPFLAYYMTVSGHFEYTFDDNMMAYKHRNEVKNLNVGNNAKAYVATQIELDRALERLINELEKAGKLDKTVIVLLADHYPYDLDMKSINSLSSYERDSIVEVNHNALILWNSAMSEIHIDKPCMSSDVLPTVYNLFGVDYDSRLFTGRDILSDSFGIAIMRNHSWVTSFGTYFSDSKKFVAKEGATIPDNYVDNINSVVNNRLNIAKLIVETDYYKYLFK